MVTYVADLLNLLLTVYTWVIIARVVLSWVSPDPFNPVVRYLYRVTEPVLRPVRRRLPVTMGLDLSPVVVLLGIFVLQHVLTRIASEIG